MEKLLNVNRFIWHTHTFLRTLCLQNKSHYTSSALTLLWSQSVQYAACWTYYFTYSLLADITLTVCMGFSSNSFSKSGYATIPKWDALADPDTTPLSVRSSTSFTDHHAGSPCCNWGLNSITGIIYTSKPNLYISPVSISVSTVSVCAHWENLNQWKNRRLRESDEAEEAFKESLKWSPLLDEVLKDEDWPKPLTGPCSNLAYIPRQSGIDFSTFLIIYYWMEYHIRHMADCEKNLSFISEILCVLIFCTRAAAEYAEWATVSILIGQKLINYCTQLNIYSTIRK